MLDLNLNTISVNDVLETLRNFKRSHDSEVNFEQALCFASNLTGLSQDYLLDAMSQDLTIDFSRLSFRDFDNTGVPFQFFFAYALSPEERNTFVSSLGYRADICVDVELCLDIYSPTQCPLEAVLTFNDHEQAWVDIMSNTKDLPAFLQIVAQDHSPCSKEALGELVSSFNFELPFLSIKSSLDSQIIEANTKKEYSNSSELSDGKASFSR